MKTKNPSQKLKKKISLTLVSLVLLILMIYPMVNTPKSHEMAIPTDRPTTKIPNLISSGDGTTSYRASYKWVEYGNFDTIGNWTIDTPDSSGSININSGYAEFAVNGLISSYNYPRIILSPEPFYYGNLTISWYTQNLESGEYLEIRYRIGTEAWTSHSAIALISSTQTTEIQTTIEFNHTQYQCYHPDFQLAIVLVASKSIIDSTDRGFVNWIQLSTWELQISETSDTIPQQTSQVINTYVYPYNNATNIDKVYINYAKSSNLANPSRVFCTLSGSYYTGTIPDSYYDYNDNVYYQVCYNLTSGIEVKSHTSNYPYFNATDTTDPAFSDASFNPSNPNYNQSTLFSITCTEISGDSGLKSLVMYMKNSSGVTTSDYSLIPNEPITPQGGVFTFSISDSVLKWNQSYYFLRAIDNSGRSKDYTETFITINDPFKPEYLEDPANTNDQNYLNDKTVYVDIWEPEDASGLNLTSIKIKYGTDPTLTTETTEAPYSSKVGNRFGFTIPFVSFPAQGQYMFFNISGKDNASNQFSTPIRSFMIKDLEPPTLSLYAQGSNHTNHPYYYQKVNMTFTTNDVAGGVGFNDIRLYVNNGSSPLSNWGNCVNVSDTKTQTGSNNYSFIIESVYLSAREDLYWLCTALDNNGNMRNLSGSFEVFDDRIPYIIFHSIVPGFQVNHSDNAIVNFEIREPMGGAGFNTDGSSLQLYYTKNAVPNNPTDGTPINCIQTTYPYGGIYQVIIPESVFAYLDTIYFWGNVSDIKGNKNNTFVDYQMFTVVDQVAPTIVIDSSSQADNSYQLDKTIQFSASEPADGSLMNTAEIFWKLGDPAVSPTNFFGYDMISISGVGGSRSFTLLASQINGRYGQRVYFILRANDTLGNLRTTATTYFAISDNVVPTFNENSKNLLDILNNNGKNFTIEAWDLDYPSSSGIGSVTLYYRLNNSAVGTGIGQYNGTLTIIGSISPDRKNYTITLNPSTTVTWIYQTEFYYKILVTDVKGNQYISPTANHFTVLPAFSVNIASPIAANPTQKIYYYNTSSIQINITTGQACDIWYRIDGDPSGVSPVYGTSYTTTVSGFSEGYHNITIYYFNEIHYRVFEFYMDFTPPSTVTNLRAQIQGTVILISWQAPSDADPFTTYEIWKKTGTGQFIKVATVDLNQYIDPAIQGSQNYQYKIITIDRAGNLSGFSNNVSIKTAMPGWMLIVIIAGIAIGAVLTMKIAISAKRTKTLRELGSMSIEEQGKLFNSMPSQEQPLTEEQQAEQRKKIRGVEDNVFVDTQEIKKELWQQIDWKSKDEYWKKRSEKFNEFLGQYILSALKFELNEDYATALKIYLIALRTAELDKNTDLDVFDFLRNKIYDIYSNPLMKESENIIEDE